MGYARATGLAGCAVSMRGSCTVQTGCAHEKVEIRA